MLKPLLWDYSNAHILVKGAITVTKTESKDANAHNTNKKVIAKNCTAFNDYISEINNAQVDNAKYIYVVMPVFNLTEYSNTY